VNVLHRESLDALLFDIDGTIADTDDAMIARLAKRLRPLRQWLPDKDPKLAARRIAIRLETPVNSIVSWLDRTGLDQILGPLVDGLYRLRGVADRSHAALIPGVKDALERLAAHYPLGIVTAREHHSGHAILAAYGLDGLFRCVATARTVRRAKPHPDPILWAVNQLEVSPDRCLMVGDTTVDILSARAAGVHAVGVLCGFGEREELEAAGADLIVDHTAEIADLLLGS
jgi:phosphoglycolate phosphatase